MMDNFSNDRIGLAGLWLCYKTENHQACKEMFTSGVEAVDRLSRGKNISRVNDQGAETQISIRPQPVQSALPVWITAASNTDTFVQRVKSVRICSPICRDKIPVS
ncbi:hypothetical protein SG35_031880 [Thalassomonas actiniarum]|uniref:Uncharacterized protein n=2 Tax=Thalassomonas actiniarum TaxID=485447 RepID=A0AAF0C4J0_9GAMM|nr:hypothetical protein SG35_031880 [Thalassomonas actiniarum]